MSRARLPAHRCAEDRHDVPPGPARRSTPTTPGRRTASTSRPARRWSARRCSTSAPRSTCSARTGAARRATPTGSWDALVRRVRRRSRHGRRSATRSSRPPRPSRSPGRCATCAGSEVHVVYSARDLGRQLPAAWQESIKQGRKWSFRRFLDRVERGPTVVLPRLRPARACSAPGAPACRRSGSTWSPCRSPARRRRRRPALAAVLRGVRHRPGLGAAGQRPRQPRRSGVAETQVIRQLNRRLERGDPPRGGVRRADPRDARPGPAGQAATSPPVRLPAAALRLGRGAGRALDRVDRAAAASTWSATSRTCARCRRRRGRALARPRQGRAREASSTPRIDALAAMTARGRAPARPRARSWSHRVRAQAPSGCDGRDRGRPRTRPA